MNNITSEENYLQYNLNGFNNLKLRENKPFEIENTYIKSICFNDDLTILTVVLNDNVNYQKNGKEIELYLDHISFNLIINMETDINIPFRRLEVIKDGTSLNLSEHVTIREEVTISRVLPADRIYHAIVDSDTAIEDHSLFYKRIFKTLHNPNLIAQFMSLYQFLMELLARERKRVEQKNVVEYFKNHADKYPFITFEPTRRKNITNSFDEDYFTYIRNEIGHSEDTNDMELYTSLGKKITSRLIKQLVTVLNDVIIEMY
jgi:hypothetical protein